MIYVYYSRAYRQWVAYDEDEFDGEFKGQIVWADTKEQAVKELQELLEEQNENA